MQGSHSNNISLLIVVIHQNMDAYTTGTDFADNFPKIILGTLSKCDAPICLADINFILR